jgi:hypothetical protein
MTLSTNRRLGPAPVLGLLFIVWLAGSAPSLAQETVDVVLPAAVSFTVFDVSVATTGSPEPTRLEFTSIQLQAGNALRVSVQADAAAFTPPAPGGSTIAASKVSWTTSGAVGGSGTPGTLSDTAYSQVFETTTAASAAQIDVHWTQAAIGGGVRSGSHDLTMRWKLESVVP